MAPRTQPLPSALRGRVFTRAEALALGVKDSRLRGPGVRRLQRNVYVDAAVDLSAELIADAALRALPAAGAVSGELAVALWALPRPLRRVDRGPDPLLTAPATVAINAATERRDNRDGLDIAEIYLPADHVVELRGRRVVSPARLFVELAATWRLDDLVALADAAVNTRLVTREDLAAAVEWATGRRGVVLARMALDLVDGGAESPMETRLRLILIHAGLPRPRANVPVLSPYGRVIARPDLRFDDYRVAVEYDGAEHADAVRRARDEARRVRLREHGWLVLTFTSQEVLREPWLVVSRVTAELRARGWAAA